MKSLSSFLIHKYFLFILLVLLIFPAITCQGSETPIAAVIAFENHSGVQIPNMENMGFQILESSLLSSGTLTLVDRATVQKSLTEIGFNISTGLVDPNFSIKLGKMLGARYLITADLIDLTTKTIEFKGYDVETKKTAVSMTVGMRVVDAEKGTVFFIRQETAAKEFLPTEINVSENETFSIYQKLMEEAITRSVQKFNQKISLLQKEGTQKENLVQIKVNSDPVGADVEIGGLFYANTPCEISLEEGKIIQIQISLAGYMPWVKNIKASTGLEINAKLGKETPVEPSQAKTEE